MSPPNSLSGKTWLGLAAAVVVSASMWFYVDRIFVPRQVEDQKNDQVPRGNLSDLYPRWLGARELLLHGRNPYADDLTREYQIGYYGRALDPSRKTDPQDREAFAYPVYVVFLLAPFVHFPFHYVQWSFHWVLIVLTLCSAFLWLRALRWRLSWRESVACAILLVSSVPGLQAIKLQQLTLLVAFLLAAAAALIAEGWLGSAGVLLALATIKPQLAWPLVVWFSLWVLRDWRARRRLALSFTFAMAALIAGGLWLLPGWLGLFVNAVRQYHAYTHNISVLEADFGPYAGRILAIIAALVSACRLWRLRGYSAPHPAFDYSLALVMALTVLIVPMIAPYNQVLLFPSVLYLARCGLATGPLALRFADAACIAAISLPWVATLGLMVVYVTLSPSVAAVGWKLPFLTTFSIPLLAFACVAMRAPACGKPRFDNQAPD